MNNLIDTVTVVGLHSDSQHQDLTTDGKEEVCRADNGNPDETRTTPHLPEQEL